MSRGFEVGARIFFLTVTFEEGGNCQLEKSIVVKDDTNSDRNCKKISEI